jgi:hypothetical protein
LSAADFAALARSSPERWSTLRFTARWTGDDWRAEELRAWLRRPDRLRVETVDGVLVQVVHESPDPGGPFDAPMYRDYFWVAMLNPVELADGFSEDAGAVLPGTEIGSVVEVDHAGRPAWEAVLRPTPAYQPRCTCCSLLRSREVDLAEAEAGAGDKIILAEYPTGYRVRLDVGTGVCVFTEPIGGSTTAGHEVRIEAVDEPMDDSLFVEPPRPEPQFGWSPAPGLAPVERMTMIIRSQPC